jgi:hypothetical protein
MEMNNPHPHHSNWLETIVYICFTIGSYIWAHACDTESVLFKVIIAPAIGATVGFFIVKFWKWLFPDKQ